MKAKTYFWILTIVLLCATGIIAFISIKQGIKWYFIATEVLFIIVLILLTQLYLKTIKPLNTIASGMYLLKGQDFSSRLGSVKQKDTDHIIEIFNKMMEQLKDERLRLREQNHFLDLLINSSPMGVIILDLDDYISSLNPIASKIIEVDNNPKEIYGKKLGSLNGVFAKELSNLSNDESKMVHLNDGNIYKCTRAYFINKGFNHSFYLIEKMTEELIKAERKAYEQVIRMISHEVNNSMAGISSSIDMVQNSLSDLDLYRDNDIIEILTVTSDRCINLSKFITKFADVVKIPEPTKTSISLNNFIRNRALLLESIAIGKDIDFSIELTEKELQIEIDPILMEQAVINIIKNAIEAVSDTGWVKIKTFEQPLSLVISNNGETISEKVEKKLFTPFFSTKPNGQGIGLLLIREILLKHNCKFSLKTDSDGITRFIIYF